MRRVSVLAILFFTAVGLGAQTTPLKIQFNDKPPFFYFDQGKPTGFLVATTVKIFEAAGIPYVMEPVPFNRIIDSLKATTPNVIALGFSKTTEREGFINFSLPIYKDKRAVLLVRAEDKAAFDAQGTLGKMIESTRYTFGGVRGNTYPIDAQLRQLGPRDTRADVSPVNLINMLVAKRFDFMLAYPEEVDYLLKNAGVPASSVGIVTYQDLPDGGFRYLLLSKAIDQATLARINRAIQSVVKL